MVCSVWSCSQYWRIVWRLSRGDAWRITKTQILGLVLGMITGAIGNYSAGWDAAVLGAVLGAIAGFLVFAAWTFATAVTRAPAALHGSQRQELAALRAEIRTLRPVTDKQVSFLELRKVAVEYGWDFRTYSDQLGRLIGGLRQAAIDVERTGITILGRANSMDKPESMKLQYPLVAIPLAHLPDWWIDYNPRTNWNITTHLPGRDRHNGQGYRDLYVSSEAALRKWLRTHGEAFKTPTCNVTARTALLHIMSTGRSIDEAISCFQRAALSADLMVYGKQNSGDGYISMGH